ncbi:glucose-6-phosphate isomerase [Brackiella oedipodis]|uniref:glucose-6-phosphate isomerase n=1 Tax=Brackiella oedipodis TaxID=124225 RepID=UPI0009FDCB94|nr:glucose-6-phosphate isomerase [Brackiella oedipodis]
MSNEIFCRTPLDKMPEWAQFTQATQQANVKSDHLRILNAAGLSIDLSTQRHSQELDQAGETLLQARNFTQARQALFNGTKINTTENRAAWHTMLREPRPLPEVAHEYRRMLEFVRRTDSERRWRNIVHIGIGGSDWGVRLLTSAFGYTHMWRNIRFVANVDGHAIESGLAGLDPKETLVVVATKSFTTAETMANAQRALDWLKAGNVRNPFNQIIGITANPENARAWGIPDHNLFRFWDWVGGRFSLWSSVGVAAGLTVGTPVLAGLISGAHAMDQHFLNAPFAENAPVQLALAGIGNRSVLEYGSHNIAVYDSRLSQLVPYLQQLIMESLGKSVDHYGEPINVPTGPVVWGMPGTDAQHTFFQWLHQGSDGAPIDFIVCQEADHQWPSHHRKLLAHCLAQRQALWTGKSIETAYQENLADGKSEAEARLLAKHRALPGGRPSTLIVMPRLTPFALGALLALYEHKVFVQGLVWGLNPFDQWGVELGKQLAGNIEKEINGDSTQAKLHDSSTAHWINTFRNNHAS